MNQANQPGASAHKLSILGACMCLLLVGFSSCKGSNETPSGTNADNQGLPAAEAFAPGSDLSDSDLEGFHVVLTASVDGTALDPMTFDLWPEAAPKTVRNFLRLARSGFYDGLSFHRVIADFMVQGGCSAGNGSGGSPFGSLSGEFNEEAQYRHRFGVLSMARGDSLDSAGSQFFIICRNGPKAWALDGKYASFGRMVSGKDTLLALSEIPVIRSISGEVSKPTFSITINRVQVVAGPAPPAQFDEVEREKDRFGPPNTVQVQTLLVATKGGTIPTERDKEAALAFAQELLQRAEQGEDFDDLVRQYSEDPVQMGQETPPGFIFSDHGSTPVRGLREVFAKRQEIDSALGELQAKKRQGELDGAQVIIERDRLRSELLRTVRSLQAIPRAELPSLADIAFEMEAGEIQLVSPDKRGSLQGYYLMRRIE